MSFECDLCHRIATGRGLHQSGHVVLSQGPCETCRGNAACGDCHCSGDWPQAAAEGKRRRDARRAEQRVVDDVNEATKATKLAARAEKAVADLLTMREELREETE